MLQIIKRLLDDELSYEAAQKGSQNERTRKIMKKGFELKGLPQTRRASTKPISNFLMFCSKLVWRITFHLLLGLLYFPLISLYRSPSRDAYIPSHSLLSSTMKKTQLLKYLPSFYCFITSLKTLSEYLWCSL